MLPHLRKDIKPGRPGTLRLGQDGATGRPAIPGLHRETRRVGFYPTIAQFAVADATSTDTPGPMVELIETFFM